MTEEYQSIILGILALLTTVGLSIFIIYSVNPIDNFESACNSFGGKFFIMENVTCEVLYPYCAVNCILNDNQYNIEDLTNPIDYNRYFCIEDCKYHNKEAGETVCAC